jgi:hypothetical protein
MSLFKWLEPFKKGHSFSISLYVAGNSNDECKIITIGRSIVLEAGVEDDAEAMCSSKSGS